MNENGPLKTNLLLFKALPASVQKLKKNNTKNDRRIIEKNYVRKSSLAAKYYSNK